MKSCFVWSFLFIALSLFFCEANRITSARVPLKDARGASGNGDYICFDDTDNGFQICYQEGTAPRFNPGEPGYGTQSYLGYYASLSNVSDALGWVYGHSFSGKVNTYLWFQTSTNLYSYAFDYCPQIWQNPPNAWFSVYHVIVGSLTNSSWTLISKDPFNQQNEKLGVPGGLQIACSTNRFPIPPASSGNTPPDTGSRPPSNGNLRGETLSERAPFVYGENPMDGYCVYDDAYPQHKWYFVGGSYEEGLYESGSAFHQYYRGEVHDINTGYIGYAYGHAPRGGRHLIMSAFLPDQGLVTYQIEFGLSRTPTSSSVLEGGYLYVGSPTTMSISTVFQRSQFYYC